MKRAGRRLPRELGDLQGGLPGVSTTLMAVMVSLVCSPTGHTSTLCRLWSVNYTTIKLRKITIIEAVESQEAKDAT